MPTNYENLIQLGAASPAPDSSSVVLADVRGSTAAIQAGRYRDVNMVGAACIAVVRNNFPRQRIPYVFGGDGASFLVEAADLAACLQQLATVQRMARDNLGLELRVGHVPVSRLRAEGAEIFFGFLSWSENESLPFFRGDGLRLAEDLIKQQHIEVLPASQGESEASVHAAVAGVSCRLEPFESLRGRVLSLLIEPQVPLDEEDEIFRGIFQLILTRGAIDRLSPLSSLNLRRPWINSTWRSEARLQQERPGLWNSIRSRALTFLSFLLVTAIFRSKKSAPGLGDTEAYTRALLTQSDWIKIDGTLRLVIDVTPDEEAELRQLLLTLERQGKLLFGIHSSKAALMTCHYQSGQGQKHVHFVDGSDGGLTLAAVELKQKKQEKAKAKSETQKMKIDLSQQKGA